jgi:dolichol-phosphate mannosyltransferase
MMSTVPALSVVIPLLNEEECLPEFYRRISAACDKSAPESYELVFVNDGSVDRSLEILLGFQRADPRVKIVDMMRNHGHQLALSAGLAHATGARVLAIDADLQDPPELLPAMMSKMDAGADVVYAQRNRRAGESRFKLATAALFYRLLARLSDASIPVDAGDFRLMSRRVIDIIVSMPESHRFIRGLVAWVGLRQVPLAYDRAERFAGRTKYPLFKMIAFSLDAITAFAAAPLRIVFLASTVAMVLAAAAMLWTFYSFFFLDAVAGWSSLMVVFLFFTSIQLFSLAFIGEYVGRTFMESKGRPLYLIKAVYSSNRPSPVPETPST